MKNFTQKFIGLLALVFSMVFSINAQEIGDLYEGGYIFQINEDGTGLVADLQDLGLMNWDDAMDTADVYTSQGYDDWYLPSKEELELIYNTIGTSSDDNIGGFDYSWYWSSSEYSSNYAWFVSFGNGGYDSYDKTNAFNVRVIRSVTFDTEVSGCTDSSANNYNVEATIDDESCTYAPVILLTPPTVEFTNGETLSLVSSQDLWDLGAIYDADNSLEELTITLSVNPDKINLVWDGGINSNPTVSAVSDFSGSTEIEICISDAISSVCGSNIIIVYEDSSTEEETADKYLDLPEGWSMFGYTCIDSVDAIVGFSSISDKIEIVKDEWGLSYLPSWEFNAMGSLQFSEGYQIKMIEEVTDFQFCEAIVPEDGIGQPDVDAAYAEGAASVTPEDGVSQADVDAAVAAVVASYAGWCASDIDNDGICDADEVSGCMDASSCNYVAVAEFDDSSCEYTSCLDECGVINGDNSTCLDCAGVVNGTSEDLGCGCGNPQAQAGYDCDGNEIELQIGDQHAGGIVFQINEDGTGLVADLQDLGLMDWNSAMDAAPSATSQGYDDWYLPSIDELELMYNTIGNGGPEGNIGGFVNNWYWTSSEYNYNGAWIVSFINGDADSHNKANTYRVRVIRAF